MTDTPMNGALELRDTALVDTYAREHGLNGRKMYETLAATIFPSKQSATPEQVNALLIVARAYGLNPFTKEVYAFPAKGGAIVPIVSVDGWAKLANTHPQCAGIEISVHMDEDGKTPISATCRVHRKDWAVPFELTEYLHEVRRNTVPWNGQPIRMLRHRAMIQAVRIAFGFGGLYEADEAARNPDVMAPAEYRESEVVRRDPLSLELNKTTTEPQAPLGGVKQGESETAGAAVGSGGPVSPHAAAIAAFVVLGVPSSVIEAEIAHMESEGYSEDVTPRLRGLYNAAKNVGPGALITRLRSEKACDMLDSALGAPDAVPAAKSATDDIFGDTEAARED
jgi:phage recombination protein Bet